MQQCGEALSELGLLPGAACTGLNGHSTASQIGTLLFVGEFVIEPPYGCTYGIPHFEFQRSLPAPIRTARS